MRRSPGAAAVLAAMGTVPIKPDYIRMVGGLDQVTAPLQRKSGTARVSQNFEAEQLGGYRRIAGYERFDGQAKPSSASYTILAANITGSPAVGNTLTGATSGATGVIISIEASAFVLTKVVGTFVSGENLNVGGPTIATSTAAPLVNARTLGTHATYKNLAADEYRVDIDAVPGEGAILGGFWLNDVCYAFRNDVGSTAARLYKSTSSGWSAVALGRKLLWTTSGAGVQINDGDVVTGATSGASGTVTRAMLESGTWATGAGKLIFASITGTFQNGENLQVGGVTYAVASGADAAITLLPSGRYETVKENFGGSVNTKRIYGCDGVNPGFEFDGTVFCPIKTGMTTDTPDHVFAHKKHLFFSFEGSVQHSGTGTPYMWTVVTGAAEFAMGDEVSGFALLPGDSSGGALAIFTRNRTSILYGSSSSDWNLVPFRDELGAYPYTIQDVGFTIYLDDRGVTDLQTVQAFGNFAHNTLTDQIRNLINDYRTLAIASCISRDRNQYRLFFTNGRALYITVSGRKVVGSMPMVFPNTPRCAWSSEMNDGSEVMFMGSDDGWVFQLDKGTSFDGEAIDYELELAYNFSGDPRVIKRYRDMMLEIIGTAYVEFSVGYTLGYGSTDIAQPANQTVQANFAFVRWDSFVWDAFVWDGQTLLPAILKMDGEAENYSIGVRGSSDEFEPFTLTGAVVQYTPRRRMR